jgi:hypothetical protein
MDVTFIKISNFEFRPRLVLTYFWGWFESLFSSNFDYSFILMFPMGETMNKGDYLDCYTCHYSGLHPNVKFKTIFKINMIKILFIHVFINFNRNHHEKFG